MANMNADVYSVLRRMGATEDDAEKAATAVASGGSDRDAKIAALQIAVTVLTAMVTINLALTGGILWQMNGMNSRIEQLAVNQARFDERLTVLDQRMSALDQRMATLTDVVTKALQSRSQ